jgi:dethiobiotin synthetase
MNPLKPSCFFIAGTDTGIGKTFITSLIALFFTQKGLNVLMQKWAQTGGADDALLVYEKMNKKNVLDDKEFLKIACPYKFSYPASPHLASMLENQKIDIEIIKRSYYEISKKCEILLVEGSGGIMVPLTEDTLFLDLLKELGIPVILVARAGLGTINHTLMTAKILENNNVDIFGIILNNYDNNSEEIIINDNAKIILKFSGVKNIIIMPYSKENQGDLQLFDFFFEGFYPPDFSLHS